MHADAFLVVLFYWFVSACLSVFLSWFVFGGCLCLFCVVGFWVYCFGVEFGACLLCGCVGCCVLYLLVGVLDLVGCGYLI